MRLASSLAEALEKINVDPVGVGGISYLRCENPLKG